VQALCHQRVRTDCRIRDSQIAWMAFPYVPDAQRVKSPDDSSKWVEIAYKGGTSTCLH